MSINPEYKETTEKFREQKEYQQEIEDKILDRLARGIENYPSIIVCPVQSCRNPVTVKIEEKLVMLKCPNCGWEHVILRK